MQIVNILKALKDFIPRLSAKKQDEIFGETIEWDGWSVTKFTANRNVFRVGNEFGVSVCSRGSVEREFPGFCKVFEQLSALGCDEHLVTIVLKHLIEQKNGRTLERRLENSDVLTKINVALALGITGDEFATYIKGSNDLKTITQVLPPNVMDV